MAPLRLPGDQGVSFSHRVRATAGSRITLLHHPLGLFLPWFDAGAKKIYHPPYSRP